MTTTTSLCSLWSVMMNLAVFVIVPNVAWCHLSSALKAGSAEGKPPILSHVRVSREPQSIPARLTFRGDVDTKRVPMIQTSRIKSPSYQHKVLQFHSNAQTSSGQDFFPTKILSASQSKSVPVYPVASKVASARNYLTSGDYDEDEGSDSWENFGGRWQPQLLPEPEEPTFTPYVGARALTNIPGFFQHLKENIAAIKSRGLSSPSSQSDVDRMVMTIAKDENDENKDEEISTSSNDGNDELVKMIATPTRRGYSSNSDTEQQSRSQPEQNGDGLKARDSRSGGPYTLVYQEPDAKTKELLRFLGHGEPEYPRANRYNPGWLFTNLGLGKRSIKSEARFKQY